MAWHQLSVITDQDTAPALSDFFSDLGAVSVTFMDAEDHPVYEPPPGETRIWDHTRVIALFELDIVPELVKKLVFDRFRDDSLQHWQQERIEDQAWERAWMEHYRPMRFGKGLWVCPSGQERRDPDSVCMTLDPGLAFGTGTHPTTALCLQWLATHPVAGRRVIDYGCGSGILAVAALLLGARNALCVDIDPQALEATQSNAEKNAVENRIFCFLPEQFPAQECDIVLANILANPLIELAESIGALVRPGGRLVLSGILNEQADEVMKAYRPHGLIFDPPQSEEGWTLLEAIKSA